MKISTIICAALFLFVVTWDGLEIPGYEGSNEKRKEEEPARSGINEINLRIAKVQSVLQRLDRTEKILFQRLDEVIGEIKKTGSSAGYTDLNIERISRACEAELRKELVEVRRERASSRACLERLKTKRVRLEARREILKTAAERKEASSFLETTGDDGPLNGLLRDIEPACGRGIRYEEL